MAAPAKKESCKHQQVVYPNANIFPDYDGFWNQDEINMFMLENWVKLDDGEL